MAALARPAEHVATGSPTVRLTVRSLMVAATFVGIFTIATHVAFDTDTWWHLRAGQWMVEHRQVLTHDPFSWTRAGSAWIDHSWLSQVPMYLVWERFGIAGLNLAIATFVTLAFWFVYLQSEGSVYLRTFVLMLAAVSSAVYWWARPEIVSFALAAVFAYVLGGYRWRGINRLWVLPPLMALWVNVHGAFVIGLLLLTITVAGQIGSRIAGQRGPGVLEWRGVLWLAIVGAACAAAVLANPHGWRMLLYPLHTVSIGALRDFIHEWMSPDFHVPEAQGFVWLLLATLAALGLSQRRMDLTDLLLLSAFVYLALLARRNIALFALIAPPILTRHAAAALGALGGRYRALGPITDSGRSTGSPHGAVNWVLLAVMVALGLARVSIPLQASVNEAALRESMPVGAVDYIRESHPQGRMFNSYNWGGYLAWALPPNYPVYIDGRTDLYGDAFLREYLRAVSGDDHWRTMFTRDDVRLVVIERDAPLAHLLSHESGWRLAYSDSLASVFTRK